MSRTLSCRVAGAVYNGRQAVIAQMQVGDYVTVTAEPDNGYDKDALAVSWMGQPIGYIPAAMAADLAGRVHKEIVGKVRLITGGDQKYETLWPFIEFSVEDEHAE